MYHSRDAYHPVFETGDPRVPRGRQNAWGIGAEPTPGDTGGLEPFLPKFCVDLLLENLNDNCTPEIDGAACFSIAIESPITMMKGKISNPKKNICLPGNDTNTAPDSSSQAELMCGSGI